MALDIKAALHKPWVKYGLIAIGFVGVFYILHSRENASTSSSDGGESDADVAAQAAVAQTQIQASAAGAAQDSAQGFQLAQQKEADTTSLAGQAAGIAGQLQLTTLNNSNDQALANVQLQGLQAQLNEAFGVQKLQADEQSHISDNQTSVALNQTNAGASVANHASNNAKNTAIVGGVIGAIASFF